MQPRIVRAVYDQQGNLLRRIFAGRRSSRLLPTHRGRAANVLARRRLHGTGDPTAQIPGYATAGKTGTAQMVVDGGYRSGYYAASFIGMVPYPHARYLIYVKVERPIGSYYGSVVAAPAFAAIARAAMLHAGVLPSTDVAHPWPLNAERRVGDVAEAACAGRWSMVGIPTSHRQRDRDRFATRQTRYALRRVAAADTPTDIFTPLTPWRTAPGRRRRSDRSIFLEDVTVVRVAGLAPRAFGACGRVLRRPIPRARRDRRYRHQRKDDDDAHDRCRFSMPPAFRAVSREPSAPSFERESLAAREHDAASPPNCSGLLARMRRRGR